MLYSGCNYWSILGLKLNHVSEGTCNRSYRCKIATLSLVTSIRLTNPPHWIENVLTLKTRSLLVACESVKATIFCTFSKYQSSYWHFRFRICIQWNVIHAYPYPMVSQNEDWTGNISCDPSLAPCRRTANCRTSVPSPYKAANFRQDIYCRQAHCSSLGATYVRNWKRNAYSICAVFCKAAYKIML